MTPRERAVKIVETPGWIVETKTPISVPVPMTDKTVDATVRNVTIKCPMLVELIEAEITAAVDEALRHVARPSRETM